MRHSQLNGSTARTLAGYRRYMLGVLLISLLAFGLTTTQPATGQRKPNQGYGKELEVPAGYDLLKTVEGRTFFRFMEEFTIPAGFFDRESRPFAGIVRLKGAPIGSFRDMKTSDADTIIERTKATSFAGLGRASVQIEVVALSLESTKPINVRVGREWQQWHVKFGLSPNRKSVGTLTLARRNERGGTLSSAFAVFGLLTFTRASDGAEKTLDVGAMKLDAKSVEKITLRTSGASWSQNASATGLNAGFQVGVSTAGLAVSFDESSRVANHRVVFVAF